MRSRCRRGSSRSSPIPAFLTVLEDEGLLPIRASRARAPAPSSMGTWAAGLDAPVLARELDQLERRDFWDPGMGAGLLRGRLFRERLERLLPEPRVRRLPRCPSRSPPSRCVRDAHACSTSGDLGAAIQASCAVPLLFHPVAIDGRSYLDGGILDRPGLAGMPRGRAARPLPSHRRRSPRGARSSRSRSAPAWSRSCSQDLPRSGPFQLEAGREAFRVARAATKRALDVKIEDGLVIAA